MFLFCFVFVCFFCRDRGPPFSVLPLSVSFPRVRSYWNAKRWNPTTKKIDKQANCNETTGFVMFCYLFIFYFHAFTEPLLINIERWFRGKKPFEFSQTIGERLEQERAMWGGGDVVMWRGTLRDVAHGEWKYTANWKRSRRLPPYITNKQNLCQNHTPAIKIERKKTKLDFLIYSWRMNRRGA